MDIIANSLTKIRNAAARKSPKVDIKKSGVVENILNVMKREGYINDFRDSDESPYSYTVLLKYANGKSVLSGIRKVSRLSRRVYCKADKLPKVLNNYGIAIISTSKGVLTDKEARTLRVGGEVLCTIW